MNFYQRRLLEIKVTEPQKFEILDSCFLFLEKEFMEISSCLNNIDKTKAENLVLNLNNADFSFNSFRVGCFTKQVTIFWTIMEIIGLINTSTSKLESINLEKFIEKLCRENEIIYKLIMALDNFYQNARKELTQKNGHCSAQEIEKALAFYIGWKICLVDAALLVVDRK